MRTIGLRRFQGTTLTDSLRYLRVDLPKAFLDLTTSLRRLDRRPQALAQTASGSTGSSGGGFQLDRLVLPAGCWHVTASATINSIASSHAVTLAGVWLTRNLEIAGVPVDAILGYNYTTQSLTSGDMDLVSLQCHWLLEVSERTAISLQGSAIYSGGAGTPTYQCALVAHGYITE